MKYIWANFITTIKDWNVSVIENQKLRSICLSSLQGLRSAPYLSDQILYSIQSRREGRLSSLFPNDYEADILNIAEQSRKQFQDYFAPCETDLSYNFDEAGIQDYRNTHAYSHVCGTHFASLFEASAGLCIDYLGYKDAGNHQVQSLWTCVWHDITLLDDFDTTLTLDRGIGFGYSLFADIFDIYKYDIPYLCLYWDSSRYADIPIFEYKNNQVFLRREFLEGIDMNPHIDLLPKTFYASIEELGDNMQHICNNIQTIFGITGQQMEMAQTDISQGIIPDILAHLQSETTKAVLYLAQKLSEKTQYKNLCVSGWIASDHLLCQALVEQSLFEQVFFEASPNYAGISLGAVYELYHIKQGNTQRIPMIQTGYGKCYSDEDIFTELKNYQDRLHMTQYENQEQKHRDVATQLQQGQVIAYFSGWAEVGGKGLWNRSILVRADDIKMAERVRVIKEKPLWKPFSCSILASQLQDYFGNTQDSSFMSMAGRVQSPYQTHTQALNQHPDMPVRYQSVEEQNNPDFHGLLTSYQSLTGISLLLNSSLHGPGQAIIESPKQALDMFLSSDIDILILENYSITKSQIFPELSYNAVSANKHYNMNYFSCNRRAVKNFSLLQALLEKIVCKGLDVQIPWPKYFESTIDIHIWEHRLSLEQKIPGKSYYFATKNIWVCAGTQLDDATMKGICARLLQVDSQMADILKRGDYFLKDLLNYL